MIHLQVNNYIIEYIMYKCNYGIYWNILIKQIYNWIGWYEIRA